MDITQMLVAAAASGPQPGATWINNTTTTLATGAYDSASSGSAAVCIAGTKIYRSTDGANWTVYNPFPALAVNLLGVEYVNSEFVVWASTFFAVSSDGITWTTKTYPGTNLRYVYGNGTNLVAVAYSGTGYYSYVSSDNGGSWVQGSTTFTTTVNTPSQMIWDGTRYVLAVYKYIYASTDGLAWTLVSTFSTDAGSVPKSSIGYSGSVYFSACYPAVGTGTFWELQTSTNGTTWTTITTDRNYGANNTQPWIISWDASTSKFLVKSINGYVYSSTGTNATLTLLFNSPADASANSYSTSLISTTSSYPYAYKTVKIGSYYTYPGNYAIGSPAATPNRYSYFPFVSNGLSAYTSGAINSSILPFSLYKGLSAITFNSKYIVSGGPISLGAAAIYYSADGSTWTGAASLSAVSSASLVYSTMCASPSKAVAFFYNQIYSGSIPSNNWTMLVTADGVTWTPSVTSLAGSQTAAPTICWTGSEFVYIVDFYTVYSSADGSTWTNTSFAFGSGGDYRLLAVDSTYAYAYNTNGASMWRTTLGSWSGWISFTPSGLASFTSITKVIYGNYKFIAAGINGSSTSCIAYSTDGINFTLVNAKISAVTDIYWSGSLFVAVSSTTGISTSSDGINWTLRTSATTPYSVTYKSAKYVAPGQFGQTITSS